MSDDVTPPATRLALVRHARPVIEPDRPAGEWALAGGQDAAIRHLAQRLGAAGVDVVLSSPEPKAQRTALILRRYLDLPLHEEPAFREQGNDEIPWLEDPAGFHRAVDHHFMHPDERVFGSESSTEAASRFAEGVTRAFSLGTVPAIVTHGRVMCGYLRDAIGIAPMDIWPHLRMPDAFIVDLDTRTLERVRGEM